MDDADCVIHALQVYVGRARSQTHSTIGEEKTGFTVMFGNTADPMINNVLLPMMIITKGKTSGSIDKFLRSPEVNRTVSGAQGESNTGSKAGGWAAVPPQHAHLTGTSSQWADTPTG